MPGRLKREKSRLIGVISDTHGLVRPEVIEAFRGVELIVHAGDVGRPEVLTALVLRVQKLARAVRTAMGAEGVTVHQFNEPAGGQSVYHIHFHVMPRWEGVALRPHGGKMADPAVLKGHADKIRAALAAES